MTRGVRVQRVETERETIVLGPCNDFGEEIGHHLLSDAKAHLYISKTNVAAYQMVPNLKMPHITQLGGVGSNMKARLGIRIQTVWFLTRETQETHHIFRMKQLLACHASGHELG